MKPYFLCMESGGTKTLTCGIDSDGNIIYEYHNGVGSPAVDYEQAIKNIFEGIENVSGTFSFTLIGTARNEYCSLLFKISSFLSLNTFKMYSSKVSLYEKS